MYAVAAHLKTKRVVTCKNFIEYLQGPVGADTGSAEKMSDTYPTSTMYMTRVNRLQQKIEKSIAGKPPQINESMRNSHV